MNWAKGPIRTINRSLPCHGRRGALTVFAMVDALNRFNHELRYAGRPNRGQPKGSRSFGFGRLMTLATSFGWNRDVNQAVKRTKCLLSRVDSLGVLAVGRRKFDRLIVSERPYETAGKSATLPDCFHGATHKPADPLSPTRKVLSHHSLHSGGDASPPHCSLLGLQHRSTTV